MPMKTKRIFLAMLFSVIVMGMTRCEDRSESETLILEISPDNGQTAIRKDVDGIVFNFCLLNEEGKSATIFEKKENIIFSFLIENNLGCDISVPTNFIDSTFYRVYRQIDNADMGKPWTGLWCEYSMANKKVEIASSETYSFVCPWILTKDHQPDYPICMSESKDYLSSGNYYTIICLDFQYFQESEQKTINNMIFKINFKVQ